MDPILEDVNDRQREAITHAKGPLLVVAGAGSGKTRVITRRVAWLIGQGVEPHRIVALTFTNKAAREMRERVRHMVASDDLWVSTFHSFSARVLRRFADRIGYSREFSIFDTDDQKQLLRAILKERGFDDLRAPDVSHAISRQKNGMFVRELGEHRADAYEEVMRLYAERLKESNAMDFDDLLLNLARLVDEDPEARDRLRRRCEWLLVDEYQDTNEIQYRILKQLAAPGFNICATGDPDQSIYRWRGATIRNILAFERDFPGAAVVTLDRNYRSTQTILAVANAVIRHNHGRYEKDLHTLNERGAPVRELRCIDATDEARAVAREILGWVSNGSRLREIATLYRVNAQSRLLEQAMIEQGIPYALIGTVAFYKRREIKDLLAYVRTVRNPADAVSFWRIFNVPSRKLGEKAAAGMREAAFGRGLSPRETLRDRALLAGMGRPRKALEGLANILDRIEALPSDDPAAFVEGVIEASGYREHLGDGTASADQERLENIRELVTAAAEYMAREPDGGIDGFVEEHALVSDQDTYEEGLDKVTLMTVHAAKGLEFSRVAVTGMEEELFPHTFSLGTEEEIEEERRLFYVAATRAKEELTLLHAEHRMRMGVTMPSMPSRFLREIPAEFIAVDDQTFDAFQVSDDEPAFHVSEDAGPGGGWRAGDRVRHNLWGAGRIFAVTRRAGATRLTVDFDENGRRELALEYANLERG